MPRGAWKTTVALRRGALELQVVPALGACWAALLYCAPGQAPVHILRPLPQDSEDLFDSGGYVLVPYSNRLFGHQLLAGSGDTRAIALNRPAISDPVHGVGWMKAWAVAASSPDTLTLSYHHGADAHWPYAHACQLHLAVGEGGVSFRMTVHNLSEQPMPVGVGFHPFLAIDGDSQVFFDVAARWEQDDTGVPTHRVPTHRVPVAACPPQGHAAALLQLNHCFGGWSGPVRLTRPQHGMTVELCASNELDHLQVYRRAGMPWLCMEPVSHATGAWSLPQVHHASAGLRWLPPGAQFRGWVELSVRVG